MKIVNNTMVKLHYRLTDMDSESLLESTYDAQAKEYIYGVSEIPEGLAIALAGKLKGDNFDVTLSPEKAYGQYDSDKVGRISINYVYLPGGRPVRGKLKPGTMVEVRTEYGSLEGSVIKQGLKTVDIDANHPYAGKVLKFSVEIIGVREATADELSKESGCTNCSCC